MTWGSSKPLSKEDIAKQVTAGGGTLPKPSQKKVVPSIKHSLRRPGKGGVKVEIDDDEDYPDPYDSDEEDTPLVSPAPLSISIPAPSSKTSQTLPAPSSPKSPDIRKSSSTASSEDEFYEAPPLTIPSVVSPKDTADEVAFTSSKDSHENIIRLHNLIGEKVNTKMRGKTHFERMTHYERALAEYGVTRPDIVIARNFHPEIPYYEFDRISSKLQPPIVTDVSGGPVVEPSQPVSKGWFSKAYDKISSAVKPSWWDNPTVTHTLAADDRCLLKRLSDQIQEIPTTARSMISDAKESLTKAISLDGFDPRLQSFICMLTDVVVMALSDTTIAMIQLPRMLMQYGWMTTLVLDGLVLFVKQITQRLTRASDTPAPGQLDAEEEKTWLETLSSGISMFMSAINYYIFGYLPNLSMTNIVKGIAVANVGFAFARGVEHFGPFIVRLLKSCVDSLWKLWSGRPWFDQEAREVIDLMAESTAAISRLLDKPIDAVMLNRFNSVYAEGQKLSARALALGVDKDIVARYTELLKRLSIHHTLHASGVQYSDSRPLPASALVIGASGVGKSTFAKYATAAIAKITGYPYEMTSMVQTFSKGVNFQATMPPQLKFLIFDDVFLVEDKEKRAQILEFQADLGAGVPVMMDHPSEPEKGKWWYRVEYVFDFENRGPRLDLTHTPEAIMRRFNCGTHKLYLNPCAMDETRTYLDPNYIGQHTNPKDVQDACDRAWIIVDHTGRRRSFTEFCSMMVAVRNRNIAIINSANAAVSALHAGAVPSPSVVISPPPVVSPTAKTSVRAPDPDSGDVVQRTLQQTVHAGPASDQGFVNKRSAEALNKFLTDPQMTPAEDALFRKRAVAWMELSDDNFIFDEGLSKNNVPYDVSNLHSMFVPQETKKDDLSYQVLPCNWTHHHLKKFKTMKFFTFGSCCRHKGFCYRHGTKLCEAMTEKCLEVGYAGLSQWIVENPDIETKWRDYHVFVASTVSPVEDSLPLKALKWFAIIVGSSVAGFAISSLMVRLFSSYLIPADYQAAYGTRGAELARKRTDRILTPFTTVAGVNLKAKDQGNETESSTQWLCDKLNENTYPVLLTGGNYDNALHMLGLIGNLGCMPAHAFSRGMTTIHIGGRLGVSLPIIYRDKPGDFTRSEGLQVIMDPLIDFAFVVLPFSLPEFGNVAKRVIEDNYSYSQLTGMVMAARPLVRLELVNGKAPITPVPQGFEFPLGDVVGPMRYDSTVTHAGVFVHTAVPTKAMSCGEAVYTTNTHVGRGHKVVAGIQVAYSDVKKCAIFAPFTKGTIDAFIAALPPGVLNLVVTQSQPKLRPPEDQPFPNITITGLLPPDERQYQNTRNTIRPAPERVYHALEGMVVVHPVTGAKEELPPISVQPAPVWDTVTPLQKVVKHNFQPDAEVIAVYREKVKEGYAKVKKFADPRLLEPREDLFSDHEALNGIPDLGIPALDIRKSPGYIPGHKPGHLGRHYYCDVTDKGLVLKPFAKTIVDKLVSVIKSGKMPNAFVVNNMKVELRPFLKAARITSAYDFCLLVAMRKFAMHIGAIFISGQVHNGTSVGLDQNGYMGKEAAQAFAQLPNEINVDAKNFDASLCSEVSAPVEEEEAGLIRMTHPSLSEEAARIIFRLQREVFVVHGDKVYYRFHGKQSGHLSTTPDNCGVTDGIARTAFHFSKPFAGNTYDNSVISLAYGDDYKAVSYDPHFTNHSMVEVGARLGVTYTPANDKTGEIPKFTPKADSEHLKRVPWMEPNGRWHYPLNLKVLNHIHAFYHERDADWRGAVAQNVDSSLREWFHEGERNFLEAKRRLNDACVLSGIRPSDLQYEDLYYAWHNAYGGCHAHQHFVSEPLLTPFAVNFNPAGVPAFEDYAGKAVDQSIRSTYDVAPTQATASSVQMNTEAQTQTDSKSGVITQTSLTKHINDSVVAVSEPVHASITQIPLQMNPYPPTGMENAMTRQYTISNVQWDSLDPSGNRLIDFAFPESLLAIPKVAEIASRAQHLRTGVEVTVITNGTKFVGGCLLCGWVPSTDTSAIPYLGRHEYLHNMESSPVSAGQAASCAFRIGWTSPMHYYSLDTASPFAAVGSFLGDVSVPLSYTLADPPTSQMVVVMARFINPILSGYSPENTASFLARMQSRLDARKARLATLPKAGRQILQPNFHKDAEAFSLFSAADHAGKATNQSESEGLMKSITGAITTASKAVDAFGPIVGLLDKPSSVSDSQPTFISVGSDWHKTGGVQHGLVMSGNPTAYVATKNEMVGEVDAQPTWEKIIRCPGRIIQTVWPADSNPADVLMQFRVHPASSFPLGAAAGITYVVPTPLAAVSRMFNKWFGDIKFLFRVFGPASQTMTVVIAYTPGFTAPTVIDDAISGDIQNVIVDIAGDKDIPFTVPWTSRSGLKICPRIGGPFSEDTTMGWITVQCKLPINSPQAVSTADLGVIVYQAGGENFRFFEPLRCTIEEAFKYDTNLAPTPMRPFGSYEDRYQRRPKKVRSKDLLFGDGERIVPFSNGSSPADHAGEAEDQASTRDVFGKPFPYLSPCSTVQASPAFSTDVSRGPCDFLKRFDEYLNSANIDNIIYPIPKNYHAWLISWFRGYSGGMAFKAVPTATTNIDSKFTPVYIMKSTDSGDYNPWSGVAFTDLARNPIVEWQLPWSRELVYTDSGDVAPPVGTFAYTPASIDFNVWHAFTDDLSLYHFLCPRTVYYTTPVFNRTKSKAVKPISSSSRREAPTGAVPLSTFI